MPEDIEIIEDDTNAEDELEQTGPGNGSAEKDAEPAHAQISNPSTPSKPGSEKFVHAIINLLLVVVIVLVAVLAWKKYTEQDVLAAQPPVESIEVAATLDTSESVNSPIVELAPLELQSISYGAIG